MTGFIPDEVWLARLRREAAAREGADALINERIVEIAESISRLEARTRVLVRGHPVDAGALIESVERVIAEPGFALAEKIERLEARMTEEESVSIASVEEIRRTITTMDSALAEQRLTLLAEVAGNAARLDETLTAYATKDYAEGLRAEAIDVAAGDATAKVEAEALVRAEKDGRMHGHWLLSVNAGKKFAGMRLSADESPDTWESESAIEFVAERFKISTGTDFGNSVAPFQLEGGVLTLNTLLVVNGQTLGDIQANASIPPLNYIGAFASAPSAAAHPVNSVYKNTTDGHSYVRTAVSGWALYLEKGVTGAVGGTGATGATGTRGSKSFYSIIAGSDWDNTAAETAISLAGFAKVLLDQVTLSNETNFAQTRFWNGLEWVEISVAINGSLLVNGTVGATKIAADAVRSNHIEANIELRTPRIVGDEIKLNGEGCRLVANTSDGSDVGIIRVNGGGGDNRGRGGQLDVFGNEYPISEFQGAILLTPGEAMAASVRIRDRAGADRIHVRSDGDVEIAAVVRLGGALMWSGDTNLYRGGSGLLKTDDDFWTAGNCTVQGDLQLGTGGTARWIKDADGNRILRERYTGTPTTLGEVIAVLQHHGLCN